MIYIHNPIKRVKFTDNNSIRASEKKYRITKISQLKTSAQHNKL